MAQRQVPWQGSNMPSILQGPVWDEGVSLPDFGSLEKDEAVDVAVIGGGLTGITAAYLLSQAGYTVAVIEKDRLARGATGVTTAFLTQYIDTNIAELIPMFGTQKTQDILDSHASAIDLVEHIVAEENIQCEFMRCPHYIYANSEKSDRELREEQQAAAKVGLNLDLREDNAWPLRYSQYLTLPEQAKFHPLRYLAGLVHLLKERGVHIYEQTEATDIQVTEDGPVVVASAHEVRAKHVIVATYAPFNKKLFFKKAFYTSYVVQAELPSGSMPEAIYEDMYNPYHYFRIDRLKNRDRMIFGGADHRSDVPVDAEKNFRALEKYMHVAFADVPYKIVRRWSGPIVEPVDGLAFIGPLEQENVLYATGFSGTGMTYATIAAKLVTDLIRGQENPWLELYDARRQPTVKQLAYKGYDYSQELLGGAVKNMVRK